MSAEWVVVTVIIALVGLFATVGKGEINSFFSLTTDKITAVLAYEFGIGRKCWSLCSVSFIVPAARRIIDRLCGKDKERKYE